MKPLQKNEEKRRGIQTSKERRKGIEDKEKETKKEGLQIKKKKKGISNPTFSALRNKIAAIDLKTPLISID